MLSGGCLFFLSVIFGFENCIEDVVMSDGILSRSVACGMGHSMVVVDKTNVGDRLDQVIIRRQYQYPVLEFCVLFYLWCCISF